MVRPPAPSRIDRFEIKSLIGSGGMGTLYLARDTSPNTFRLVALKLLNANLDSEDLRERFGRESRTLASLSHPNVVNIHESGEYRGSPYIVMEYVRGETLAEKIKRRAPLGLTEKLKLMMELCAGLAHAHEAGIIHRDIKPANLMVDHHGRLRLLDFGIARVAEQGMTMAGVQMTQINMRIGTPGYMSPEQYEGAEIDRRSDIFAAGAVFYELLAYREAFPGKTTRQIEKKVLEEEPDRLTSRIPELDPEIEALVTRALQKNPDRRFQDATEMERALTKVWWRLGLAESAQGSPRLTPQPTPGAGKKASRAETAFQRGLDAQRAGAPEAARRYAMEALAEDSTHEAARRFLEEHDPNYRYAPTPPPPPTVSDDYEVDPTIVSSRTEMNLPDDQEETLISAPGRRRSGPSKKGTPPAAGQRKKSREVAPSSWTPGRVALGVGGLLVVVGLAAGAAWLVSRAGEPAEGEILSVTKPSNGTIVGDGILCGTEGSECSVTLATGTVASLELRPDAGFVASGYTGDCTQAGRVRMSTSKRCGATFAAAPANAGSPGGGSPGVTHTLTVFPQGGGFIFAGGKECRSARGCSWTFADREVVDLEVQADKGYTFDKFTGACDLDGRITMTAPVTCGANFVLIAGGRPAGPVAKGPPGPGPVVPTKPSGPGPTAPPPATTADSSKPSGPVGAPTSPSNPGSPSGSVAGVVAPPPPPGVDSKDETAPPPPPPVKSAEEEANANIESVLQRFRQRYEALDFEGVKRVFPGIHPGIQAQFANYTKMKFAFAGPPKIDLNLKENTAAAEVGVSQTVLSKGRTKEEQGRVKTLFVDLHRKTVDNNWVIARVRFEQ